MYERLTEARVANLTPEAGKDRLEIGDALCPGLWIRVTSDGAKSFAIRYRANGRTARYTIGRFPAVTLKKARGEASDLFDRIRKGEDPRHRKSDTAIIDKHVTVEFVTGLYLEKLGRRGRGKRMKESHVAEVRRRLLVEVVPVLGARPFESITRDSILRLLDSIERRAPRVSAHVFYDLRGLFKWAIQEGIATSSPLNGLDAPTKPEARDHVLRPEELKRILKACEGASTYNTIINLLLLTAQRRGEVTGARWTEFDLEAALWTIPKARTKNGREHRVPLSKRAVEILTGWKTSPDTNDVFLFPSKGTERDSFSGFSRCKRRLDKKADVHGWTVHDLRRTAATAMAEMGTPPHVVERILNHTSGTMTPIARVYNRHAYEAEMREALERWAASLV